MNKITKTIKFISFVTIISFFSLFFSACSFKNSNGGKIKIVATLFPQYDFARQIAKDRAEVTLLLPPGSEAHSFDPSANDMINISNSDIFLYTGKYMEPWADRLISGIDNKSLIVKDLSQNIPLIKDEHEDSNDELSENEHNKHDHEYNPHFWLDPTLASLMVDNILDALCQKDPKNSEFYKNNAESYKSKLKTLDKEFYEVVKNAKRNTIVFAGKFAHLYFVKRYNLNYEAVLKNCSAQTEPSLQKLTHIINFIKDNKIPVVYYEELSLSQTAKSICDNANVKALKFSTIHNLSKEQFDKGITYLDLMKENLENLKVGLN